MGDKLKPCPFCGRDEAEVEREGTARQSCIVKCGWCGASLESNERGAGREWNWRADDVELVRLRDENERLKRRIDGAKMTLGIALGPLLPGQQGVRGKEWREVAERAYRSLRGDD